MLPPETPLSEARRWLRERLADGARCPCCGQHAKVYRRKLNSGMARSLIQMYRRADRKWQNTTLSIDNSGTLGKLRYWGLIEAGDRRGTWRVTQAGEDFLRGRLQVPSYAEIYDDTLLKLDGPPLNIDGALGESFDFVTLMGTSGTANPWPEEAAS